MLKSISNFKKVSNPNISRKYLKYLKNVHNTEYIKSYYMLVSENNKWDRIIKNWNPTKFTSFID